MELVFNIIKGVMIGIANVIPGVSGGTMAVSFGIYDRLISSISGFTKHVKESLALLAPFFWLCPGHRRLHLRHRIPVGKPHLCHLHDLCGG